MSHSFRFQQIQESIHRLERDKTNICAFHDLMNRVNYLETTNNDLTNRVRSLEDDIQRIDNELRANND